MVEHNTIRPGAGRCIVNMKSPAPAEWAWVRRGGFPRLWPGLDLALPAGASRDLVGGDVQLTAQAAGGTDTPDKPVLDHAAPRGVTAD